ncbi:hypothetical protein BGZ46_003223 [Entomortierella lignicola]|nr:hypothetical protein BGZ46_003223 [Entomortierella lignicola]
MATPTVATRRIADPGSFSLSAIRNVLSRSSSAATVPSTSSSESSSFSLPQRRVSDSRFKREAITCMREPSKKNLNQYPGQPWSLPSGKDVYGVLYQRKLSLEYESSQHEADGIKDLTRLEDWKVCAISQYDKLSPNVIEGILLGGCNQIRNAINPPATVEEAEVSKFFMRLQFTIFCLQMLYKDNGYNLPDNNSKVWYAGNVWRIPLMLVDGGSERLKCSPGGVK